MAIIWKIFVIFIFTYNLCDAEPDAAPPGSLSKKDDKHWCPLLAKDQCEDTKYDMKRPCPYFCGIVAPTLRDPNRGCTKDRLVTNFERLGKQCFRFFCMGEHTDGLSTESNWHRASEACGFYCSVLARPDDLIALQNYMRKTGRRASKTYNEWWLGANIYGDPHQEPFKWQNGTKVANNMWAAGNPKKGHACVVMSWAKNGANAELFSQDCRKRVCYICQGPPKEC